MNTTAVTQSAGYAPTTHTRTSASIQAPTAQAKLELPPLEPPSRESLMRDTASFAADVGNLLHGAGINMPPSPVLTNDFDGHVRVANAHPDKEKIEKIFRDNPELQQRYAKISAQSSLLRGAENYSQYASEYDRLKDNPVAQRALVESEIARNKQPFFLAIGIDGAEPFFGASVRT